VSTDDLADPTTTIVTDGSREAEADVMAARMAAAAAAETPVTPVQVGQARGILARALREGYPPERMDAYFDHRSKRWKVRL
jgi:hypothetical protein